MRGTHTPHKDSDKVLMYLSKNLSTTFLGGGGTWSCLLEVKSRGETRYPSCHKNNVKKSLQSSITSVGSLDHLRTVPLVSSSVEDRRHLSGKTDHLVTCLDPSGQFTKTTRVDWRWCSLSNMELQENTTLWTGMVDLWD